MARSRNIKPGFFKNELLGKVDPLCRLLFAGLWCLADKSGRLEDRPERIQAEVFPYEKEQVVNRYLTELQRLDFIIRYRIGKLSYIQVSSWDRHQRPHHTEKNSEIPEYIEGVSTVTVIERLDDGGNPPDSLIPDSLIHNHTSTSLRSVAVKGNGKLVHSENPTASLETTRATWAAYSASYTKRYDSMPVRNARVNGQIAQLVKRLGGEAADVAAFYVGHNDARYVREGHTVGMLVAHAEKLATEWRTGVRTTLTQAQQGDKLQATGDVFKKLIAEARNEQPENP